jgi:hypothetical protein
MEQHRLKVKVGSWEFEAEGSREVVEARFGEWRELVDLAVRRTAAEAGAEALEQARPAGAPAQALMSPGKLFKVDEGRREVTLAVQPNGDRRDADAALLILFGHHRLLGVEELPVTRLKSALAVSGLRPERVDRIIAPHLSDQLVMKVGRGKGGRYRLTNAGLTRAETLARDLGNGSL